MADRDESSFEDIYDQMERDEGDGSDMDESRQAGAAVALRAAAEGETAQSILREYAQTKYGHLHFMSNPGDLKDLIVDAIVDLRYLAAEPQKLEGYEGLIGALQEVCDAEGIDFNACKETAKMHLSHEFMPKSDLVRP